MKSDPKEEEGENGDQSLVPSIKIEVHACVMLLCCCCVLFYVLEVEEDEYYNLGVGKVKKWSGCCVESVC